MSPAAVLEEARVREAAGQRVIHLEVGEPDAPTPAHVVEAAVRALREGDTRYVEPAGLPVLRAAIARHVGARGIAAGPSQVVVTSGAKPLLLHAAMATLRAGDEALVPDPGYPVATEIVRMAGAVPVPYRVHHAPLSATGTVGVDVAELESLVSPRTRVLLLNSPHNPTGTVIPAAQLDALAAFARRHDLTVISDEIYWRHVYEGAHESIATRPGMADRTIVVDGFSKAYAMTGWRLGYGVMPERLATAVTRLVVHSTSCAPPFVQAAGLAALAGPTHEMDAYVAELDDRRRWITAELDGIPGVRCAAPRGAFYVFPDVRGLLARTDETTAALARRLLHEAGVACVPGTAYGRWGDGHLRMSFAAPAAELREAVERIRAMGARRKAQGAGRGDETVERGVEIW